MSVETQATLHPRDVLHSLRAHPARWAAPTVLMTLLAVGYALVRPATWEAQQALIVRDEAAGHAGSISRPGQFGHVEEMKTAQETILELVKGRGVLGSALDEVGPPSARKSADWPSDKAIESLQGSIKLAPPKGAEFGKTEVFYLKVTDASRERALALATAISRQLQNRFEKLREMRAKSVIGELVKAVSLAQVDLETSTRKLASMEAKVGPDLAELRMLNESPSGDSEIRRVSTELANELRVHRAAVASNEELLKLLYDAQVDQGRLLATPSRLLESQPALKRLKEGLVDAQLRTAAALGSMADDHPQVQSARSAEAAISGHLHNELQIAIKGVDVDLRLARQRVQSLELQREKMQGRMSGLAEVRADYGNLVMATRQCGEILKTAQQDLSEARASQAAAHTASLISLVDKPDAGTRPAGPGRTMIVLIGLLGGLVTGLGVVFLTAQPSELVSKTQIARIDLASEVAAKAAALEHAPATWITAEAPAPLATTPIIQPAPASPKTPTPAAGGRVRNAGSASKAKPAIGLTFSEALQKVAGETVCG
jgi:uncharacterized protein involved in exopolysaccharide biosynthesis